MGQDILQHGPQNRSPLSSSRSDWVLLILCLTVLGLLVVRNLLMLPGSIGGQSSADSNRTAQEMPKRFKVVPRPAEIAVPDLTPPAPEPSLATAPDLWMPRQPVANVSENSTVHEPPSPEPVADPAPVQPAQGAVSDAGSAPPNPPAPETPPGTLPKPPTPFPPTPGTADAEVETGPASGTRVAAGKDPVPDTAGGMPDTGGSQAVYSVQVGSFLDRQLAERLLRQLRKKGFDAAVLRLKDSRDRLWHVVQIGDWPERREAELAAAEYRRNSGSPAVVKSLPPALLAERKVQEP